MAKPNYSFEKRQKELAKKKKKEEKRLRKAGGDVGVDEAVEPATTSDEPAAASDEPAPS